MILYETYKLLHARDFFIIISEFDKILLQAHNYSILAHRSVVTMNAICQLVRN
jgi:hypothetical protein